MLSTGEVRGLWSQGGSNQQGVVLSVTDGALVMAFGPRCRQWEHEALVDAERLHHQLAAAFTVCFCASEARD